MFIATNDLFGTNFDNNVGKKCREMGFRIQNSATDGPSGDHLKKELFLRSFTEDYKILMIKFVLPYFSKFCFWVLQYFSQ